MKIAVLSDIHGNRIALNAVLNDIKKLDINKYIIAGDYIMDCPQPNEVIEKIRKLDAYVINGNREKYLLDYRKGMHNEWNKHKQMASVLWNNNVLNEDNIKYIAGLPEQLSISLPKMDSIRVVHGSPFRVSEQLFKDNYPERTEQALRAIDESVLICGHTHEAWNKVLFNKLIVNPGSVGVPYNKNSFAEYAVLTWQDNKWAVSHCEVEYDLNELEQTFFESGLLQECRAWSRLILQSIKEGKDTATEFIKYAYRLAKEDRLNDSELVPDYIWDKAEKIWFGDIGL